ncbi:MAG: phosphotransferase [Actinomycetota bacterium]
MPKPKDAFIPNTPEELTASWVGEALRGAGQACTVDDIRVEQLGGGVGMTGQTVRVRIAGDGAPETAVAKFAASQAQTRGITESYDSYAREIRFYQRYADRVPVRTPKYLGADYDPGSHGQPGPGVVRIIESLPLGVKRWISRNTVKYLRPTKRRYALLIEDMGDAGSVYDLHEPPGDDELRAALEALAGLHAAFWKSPELDRDDETFVHMITSTPTLLSDVARTSSLAVAEARYEWCGPAERVALDAATRRFPENVVLTNEPWALVHGDSRSDNFMFSPDGEAIILDWALVSRGHPGYDVGYLLSSCLDADRIDALGPHVEHYRQALAAHGVDFDPAELRRGVEAAYDINAVYQLLTLTVFEGQGDNTGMEMADLWLPRVAAGLTHDW